MLNLTLLITTCCYTSMTYTDLEQVNEIRGIVSPCPISPFSSFSVWPSAGPGSPFDPGLDDGFFLLKGFFKHPLPNCVTALNHISVKRRLFPHHLCPSTVLLLLMQIKFMWHKKPTVNSGRFISHISVMWKRPLSFGIIKISEITLHSFFIVGQRLFF